MDKKNANGKRAVKDLTAKSASSIKGGAATRPWSLASHK